MNVQYVARGTPGFSGADLMNLVNEAALLVARRNKLKITQREFEDARDKVLMGAERRTLSMTDEERENTAYHEAGHAIVGLNMKGSLPIHKATIIPRGRALGMVQYLAGARSDFAIPRGNDFPDGHGYGRPRGGRTSLWL